MLEEFIQREFRNGWLHYPQKWMVNIIHILIKLGRITYTYDEDSQQWGYKLIPR